MKTFILIAAFFISGSLHARFNHHDADSIDKEVDVNVEFYNDVSSYGFSVFAENAWNSRSTGLRVSAGSLDASRFYYVEDIKFSANDDERYYLFRFNQNKLENRQEQLSSQEFMAGFSFGLPLYIGVLGEVGTFKEYGDLGLELGSNGYDRFSFRAYYYSVDHYFDDKRSEATDRLVNKTFTTGGAVKWKWLDENSISVTREYDDPLEWERPTKGFIYSYAAVTNSVALNLWPKTSRDLQISYLQQRKIEEKNYYIGGKISSMSKRMDRRVDEYAVQWTYPEENEVYNRVKFAHISRKSNFDNILAAAENFNDGEEYSPDIKFRDESIQLTREFPLADHWRFQSGLYSDWVTLLQDDNERYSYELKAQAAVTLLYTKTAMFVVNTTWDLDELARDYPYHKQPFRPWGGGNLQFTAMF